jgi:hypothetical protein
MQTTSQTTSQKNITTRVASFTAPPQAIGDWMAKLAGAGHSSHLVGECVLQLALELTPTHFLARSSISPQSLLSLAPRAIPTGVRSGAITIPTSAGPLDVLPESGTGSPLTHPESNSFRVLGLAFDPIRNECIAAPGALEDIASRSLNPCDEVSSTASTDRDPAFALEAARLIVTYDLVPTAGTLDRARKTRFEVTPQTQSRMRRLLRETLLAPRPSRGLELLRDSGVESALAGGVRKTAPDLVDRVPAQLRVRLLAWLLDADAKKLLRTLHFGGQFSSDLYRLFDHHPIDACAAADHHGEVHHGEVHHGEVHHGEVHDGEVRKLLGRLSANDVEDLLIVRRAEARVLCDADQTAAADRITVGLEQLNEAFARVREQRRLRERRSQLAISGADVMRALGCEPGPHVGRAIHHLERIVETDPGANTRERLLTELERWRDTR